jgi:16S rRNA (uracil1498-N3)-methyltransferase
MRLHRFYVNKPLGEEIVVEGARGQSEEKEILHQWLRVFRYKSGDEVILFSETPIFTDFIYKISTISEEKAALTPLSSSPNKASAGVALYMALVKKDTFETIARQATELGVSRIIPVLAQRSEKKNLNFERLAAITKEAAEQSGRGDIPVIHPILPLEEAVTGAEGINIVGSLQGTTVERPHNSFSLWVGPEGGWTEEEEVLFKEKGFLSYRLTDAVLKADTAAVALLSKLL